MAQLICRNVAVGYGSKVVLHNIDFEVHAGNYICIAGENGSGKTTLMKTILGLQKPLKGEIHLGDGLHANEIGYLPQQTVLQKDFPASVLEIVLSGFQGTCGIRPFYTRKEKKRAQKALQEVGMGRFSRNCYRELSGGQQQRVLLARALCATKKMMVLDEPVSGLDPKATAQMYALIESLNRQDGITVIMVSHDIAAALRYATHILHIGPTTFFGTTAQYLQSPQGRLFAAQNGGDVS